MILDIPNKIEFPPGSGLIKRIPRRKRNFLQAFCVPGTKTYQNQTQSAILAGYSKRSASQLASRMLLKDDLVIFYVKKFEIELQNETQKNREDKASLAWLNYLEANDSREKMFWWEEHGKLSGHYIQRVEGEVKHKILCDEDARELLMLRKRQNVIDISTNPQVNLPNLSQVDIPQQDTVSQVSNCS